ncbi:MAG: hypothetical protein ABIL07_08015 [candidate division WOR-3 bacterium]
MHTRIIIFKKLVIELGWFKGETFSLFELEILNFISGILVFIGLKLGKFCFLIYFEDDRIKEL